MSETQTVTASGGTADLDESNVQGAEAVTVHLTGDANATDVDATLLGTTNSAQDPHPVVDPQLSQAGGKREAEGLDISSEDKTVIFIPKRGLTTAAVRITNNAGTDAQVTASVEAA